MTPTNVQALAPKAKSPILTKLERIVYDRCLVTGDRPEDVLAYDQQTHKLIVGEVADQVRMDKILSKLDGQAAWWKHQHQKAVVGVRNPEDEPDHPDPDFVNKALDEAAAADASNRPPVAP